MPKRRQYSAELTVRRWLVFPEELRHYHCPLQTHQEAVLDTGPRTSDATA